MLPNDKTKYMSYQGYKDLRPKNNVYNNLRIYVQWKAVFHEDHI